MATVKEILEEVEVLELNQVGSLSILGLRWQGKDGLEYLTLDEALETGEFEVTEIDGEGDVPKLTVKNRLGKMVFLMAGEELIGAKQNRILDVSLMVDANKEVKIPVSCVESGRWSYRSRRFRSGGSSSPSRLRAAMSKMMHESYQETGEPSSDQSEVWDMVDSTLNCMESLSDSSALHAVYEDHSESLEDYASKIKCPPDCCGVAFMIGNDIAGIDFFDKPQTLSKLWKKLLRSYAIDAMYFDKIGKRKDEHLCY
ncbi:MAG: ARPP-1 family domain-containing protein [Planctomycetota bacterium]|jgi:hypothetical protein